MQLDTNQKGVAVQNRRYTVTVEVTDPGTGELKTEVTYPDSGLSFANTYTASGVLNITGQVYLTGKAIKEGEFMLEISRGGKSVLSAVCDDSGKVAFAPLPLSLSDVGLLELSLSQIPGNESGIAYDDTVYPVLVTVTDDGEGCLSGEFASPPAFRNRYEATGEARIYSQVDVDIRVELLDGYIIAACLQQFSDAGRNDTLA